MAHQTYYLMAEGKYLSTIGGSGNSAEGEIAEQLKIATQKAYHAASELARQAGVRMMEKPPFLPVVAAMPFFEDMWDPRAILLAEFF
jgi:hypothetical protein